MWTQFLDRPEAIASLYQRGPSLKQFRLAEVSWDYERALCMLRGTLARFADFPRPGWEDDANRVGIRLTLVSLEEFEMDGWDYDGRVDMTVEAGEAGGVIVSIGSEEIDFFARCAGLELSDIYAYHALDTDRPN